MRTTLNESRLDADIYVIEHDSEEQSLSKKVDIPKTTKKPYFGHLKRVYGQHSSNKYQNDLRKSLAALKQKRYKRFRKFQFITNILLKYKV